MGNIYSYEREQVYQFSKDYTCYIRPLEKKAQYICGRWGKGKCSNIEEMRDFLEEYARLCALDNQDKPIPRNKQDDYEVLERYREEGRTFWEMVAYKTFYVSKLTYPGRWEKKYFNTFHWALTMTHRVCAQKPGTEGKEPHVYSENAVQCEEPDDGRDVSEFRKKWWDMAPNIQAKAHQPEPIPRSLFGWFW